MEAFFGLRKWSLAQQTHKKTELPQARKGSENGQEDPKSHSETGTCYCGQGALEMISSAGSSSNGRKERYFRDHRRRNL